MNLRQLRYFIRVVDAGNLSRAAEQLHIAQPALGMQMRQLEESLGVALLVRHSRGVNPTPSGTLLHQRAIAIMKLIEDTKKDVVAVESDRCETIRFGLTPALMRVVGPEIVLKAGERAPQVVLSVVEDMSHILVEAALRDEVDVILAYDVPDTPMLARTAVHQDDLVLVTLPDGNRGQPVTFAEAIEERLVLPDGRDSVRTHVSDAARKLCLELKIAYEIRSIPAIKAMIARGAAAGILPFAAVMDEVRAGTLSARRIIAPQLPRTLFIAWSKKRGTFKNEPALTGVIRASLTALTEVLGPLGHPLPVRDSEM